MSGIKCMYVDSLACVRIKGTRVSDLGKIVGEAELTHVSLAIQCIYRCRDEGSEAGDGKEGSELPGGRETMEIA